MILTNDHLKSRGGPGDLLVGDSKSGDSGGGDSKWVIQKWVIQHPHRTGHVHQQILLDAYCRTYIPFIGGRTKVKF